MGIVAPFQQPWFELFHTGRARRLIQLLRLVLLFKVLGLVHEQQAASFGPNSLNIHHDLLFS
eukprot:jgi/Psemu1/62282/gm1.62282_g